MSGTAVISIACDSIEWQPVHTHASGGRWQTGVVYVNGKPVCTVSVCWPEAQPAHPVACAFIPRHAGPKD